ncbi:OLC1v1005409C1 [Oldenlandia corymbosa var. corymbosa]|uniref:OLC1v1005409C1 n=1 Tax=Oldenlandia corymbosa var. corymbosa TaxID=529605 RepID=A0AAV1DEJ5_OLDCO|nr:OLC1v1005409C1 [Oldenlandia corymbosa var. corymbosa]
MASMQKRRQDEKNIDYLPEELLSGVLQKLDASMVPICRSVRTSWNEKLQDPDFLKILRRSHKEMSRNNILMVCQSTEPTTQPNMMKFNAFDLMGKDSRVLSRNYNKTVAVTGAHKVLPITSDLICVKFLASLSILNPTSGENVEVNLDNAPIWHANWEAVFGFSDELGEYVLIALEIQSDLNMHGKIIRWDMNQKFSNTVVVWKDIQQLCPRVVEQGILVGSHVFWPIDKMLKSQLDGYKCEGIIVLYSIENENFHVLPGPTEAKWNNDPRSSHRMIILLDFKGRLCVTNPHYLEQTRHLELWAIDMQSPSQFKWDKVHDHKLEFQVARPLQPFPMPDQHPCTRQLLLSLRSSADGMLIISGPDRDQLYIYDTKNKTHSLHNKPPMILALYELSVGFYWSRFTPI